METKTDKSKTRKLKHVKIYNELYELIQNGLMNPVHSFRQKLHFPRL